MTATQAQNDWVLTVLGVDTAASGRAAQAIWASAKAVWTRASDQVDKQLDKLQAALRGSDDEDYRAIAEMGLNGVTGNHRVRLMAGLMDVDRADSTPAAATVRSLRQTIGGFINHLATDPQVDAVDTNELGVSVTVAQTLIPALQELDGAIGRWDSPSDHQSSRG